MRLAQFVFAVPFTLSIFSCQTAPKVSTPNREPQSSSLSVTDVTNLDQAWSEKLSDADIAADFRKELREELQRRVRTFPRAVRLYHYGGRGIGQLDAPRGDDPGSVYQTPLELQPPEARDYYRQYSSHFETETDESQVGPGIYAAVDPVQSEYYAKKPWILLEIRVPAGARYLDLRPGDALFFSKAFVEKWFPFDSSPRNRARTTRFGNQFLTEFRSILRVKTLRTEVNTILGELKIDALAYSWKSPSATVCEEIAMRQEVAFNFINPAFLDKPGRYRVYVQNLEANPIPEKRAAYLRVLNSIQSMPMTFYLQSNSTVQGPTTPNSNGTTTTTDLPPPQLNWTNSNYRIRALIYPWTKVLGRKYLLEALLVNPDLAGKLFDETNKLEVNAYGSYQSAVQTAFDLRTDDMAKYDSVTSYGGANMPMTNSTYVYDPLTRLKKTSPEEFSRQIADIKATTFGCSEKFPEENVTPSL